MSSYKFIIFLLFVFVNVHSSFEKSPTNKSFRSDYHYVAEQNAFYKIHSIPLSWQDAVTMCSREGARLLYPSTKSEVDIIKSSSSMKHLPQEQKFWVGAHDLHAEGVYVTLGGVDLSILYSKWAPGEPNNGRGVQHCIVMNPTLDFDDLDCNASLPYVCKKTLETITWNPDYETADLATNKSFRNDYYYVAKQSAFYKMHSIPLSWQDAVTMCSREGAHLVYPSTKSEAALIETNSIFGQMPQEQKFWVGAHDLHAEGVYVTLEGVDLSLLYSNWAPGEPNNGRGVQHCIVMNPGLVFDDLECETKLPYVCKKGLEDLTWNPDCETADLAYVPYKDKMTCYKVHTTPRSWHDAYATCHAEQSYLTIINSADEAQFLTNLTNEKISDEIVKVPYNKNEIAVGIHDRYHEGNYLTVHGETLHEAGYNVWAVGQPDNLNGNENCGSIIRHQHGALNDISCTITLLFICERDLDNIY